MENLPLFSISLLLFLASVLGSDCQWREMEFGGVCVCDAQKCDTVEPVGKLAPDEVALYVTSKSGLRLRRTTISFNSSSQSQVAGKLVVDPKKQFQKLFGFGGAFTDAAALNMRQLSPGARSRLMESYFGQKGLRYSLCRVPIASTDFSSRQYSYDDTAGDFELKHFKLAPEDVKHKIPAIREAMRVNQNLRLFGSPWSGPAWMKTSGKFSGDGHLKGNTTGQYFKTWAKYYIKFLDAYKASNISFWGLTVQNEPTTGFVHNYWFQTMGYTPEMERDLVALHLGPALHQNGYKDVKLMIMDDLRILLPQWPKKVLSHSEASKYVSGVALHWYVDEFVSPKLLDATHTLFPDKFLLASEASAGFMPGAFSGPKFGFWNHAEQYAKDIIEDMNHWVSGWLDWNMALDVQGGPSWVGNYVGASVIVNASSDEFYKQPTFYALGHFSPFVPAESMRIGLEMDYISHVYGTAFLTPEKQKVLVLLNRSLKTQKLQISEKEKEKNVILELEPRSIVTLVWN